MDTELQIIEIEQTPEIDILPYLDIEVIIIELDIEDEPKPETIH